MSFTVCVSADSKVLATADTEDDFFAAVEQGIGMWRSFQIPAEIFSVDDNVTTKVADVGVVFVDGHGE